MKYDFRLLRTGPHNAFYNMGLDQAILETVASGMQPPTLRLYEWDPPAVSIGYFQGLTEEVDLSACARNGIDVVRRITGGGAVFHQSEVTYSLILKEDHPLSNKSIEASYITFCQGIIDGLQKLGIHAQFAPINDIVVGDKKISGNAQTRKGGTILQHGTILLAVDVDLMFEILKIPAEKTKGKLIDEAKERVTSIHQLLGRMPTFEEVEDALIAGFEQALSIMFKQEEPSQEEQERAAELAVNQFKSPAWNYKR